MYRDFVIRAIAGHLPFPTKLVGSIRSNERRRIGEIGQFVRHFLRSQSRKSESNDKNRTVSIGSVEKEFHASQIGLRPYANNQGHRRSATLFGNYHEPPRSKFFLVPC
jgi:hypothetical protein